MEELTLICALHRHQGASLLLPAPTLQLSFLSDKSSGRLCTLHFPSHSSLRVQVSLMLCPWLPLIPVSLGTAHPCILRYCSSLHPWVPLISTSSGSPPHPWVLLIPASLGTVHPRIFGYQPSPCPWVLLVPASLDSSHILRYCSSPHPWVPLISTSSSTDHP